MVGSPSAPWEAVSAHEQLFVLITGANGGIGLSIAERLIDEFLATRSLRAHLILLPTTRSSTKSRQTVNSLRAHAAEAAQTSPALKSRAGSGFRWEDAAARVHVLSPQLDLCDVRGIYAFAAQLVGGTVRNPGGCDGETLGEVRIPRLDSIICNAAYGGWSGVNWLGLAISFLTKGYVEAVTWPESKVSMPTRLLNGRPEYKELPSEPPLGEVFTASVFGHYLLVRQLLPLLSRQSPSDPPPCRVIWSSSLEALGECFTLSDIQGLHTTFSYESVKRLSDLLCLTATLPSCRAISSAFLTPDDPAERALRPIPPRMYLTHPGIVVTGLFPVPWFLMWAYSWGLFLARWLGSPWHTVTARRGATSPVWITLNEQPALDALDAERLKWGSAVGRDGVDRVKATEVDGWGWEGKPVNKATLAADASAAPARVLRKIVGRKSGTKDVTQEDIEEFEETGAKCWKAMEELRHEWADRLGLKNV